LQPVKGITETFSVSTSPLIDVDCRRLLLEMRRTEAEFNQAELEFQSARAEFVSTLNTWEAEEAKRDREYVKKLHRSVDVLNAAGVEAVTKALQSTIVELRVPSV